MGRHAGPAGGVARVTVDDAAPALMRDDRGPIRAGPIVAGMAIPDLAGRIAGPPISHLGKS
jgi:hypothetical protein